MSDTVKMEDGTSIKPDPEQDISAPIVDDYDYEDTGELEIPKEPPSAWLIRLPKLLYDNWAAFDENEPIQLGYVRQFKSNNKFQLHLNPQVPQNRSVSKRYEMRTTTPIVHNTFVFSEKDLPGFKSKMKNGGKQEPGAERQNKVEKFGRYQSYRRKAIPKQTALAAYINKEMTCIPLEVDAEPRTQRLDIEHGKGTMTVLRGDVRKFARTILEPEVGRAAKGRTDFDTFKTDTAPVKAKTQENKTARMPLNDLLDKLYDCFKKYRYWSMTALRQELQQPESYLRSTLPMIADQVKSGPFNNNWKLKPEAEPLHVELAAKEESAPQLEGDGASSAAESGGGEEDDDDDDDDDDEDLQMEDVGL